MSKDKDEIMKYWDTRGRSETLNDRAKYGGSVGFREHPVWLGALPVLLSHPAGGRSIRRVADMGCGTGIIAEHLARLGYEVIAVEFAESRAKLAEQRLAAYPGVSVRLGDAANPPIHPGEVDAIISRNLLWLLPDPKAAVSCWAELVGSHGRIAAIDSLRRLDHRKRRDPLGFMRRLSQGRRATAGHSAALEQAQLTPLSNINHSDQAAEIWHQAGLCNIHTEELSWITAVKNHYETPISKALGLSKYYSVIGDCK